MNRKVGSGDIDWFQEYVKHESIGVVRSIALTEMLVCVRGRVRD